MGKHLSPQEMPKVIQNLADDMEFLDHVERVKLGGKTVYKFVFRDSFETWASFYDGRGDRIGETQFIPVGVK